ncbi:MAG: hypothetical protein AAF138_00440 [Planctomycetota bacterium]
MSAKWRRSLAWDDRHFPAWAWPAKFVLRALSSISLSVVLLTIVALYGTLASVPVGLIALAPTYLVYGFTLLLCAAICAGLCGALTAMAFAKTPRGVRTGAVIVVSIAAALYGAFLWFNVPSFITWPNLRYDSAHETGLRFFAGFVEAYDDTTLRRLPGFEMTELEFYSWWPLRIVLGLFVVNMIVATLRRIEFGVKTLGVLTVHTGIVIIALGSLYYATLKKEGDLYLPAGPPEVAGGLPGEGRAVGHFFDITAVALHVSQSPRYEQRPLKLPRYNAYGLDQGPGGETAWQAAGRELPEARDALDRPVPRRDGSVVDEDLEFRLVGYAPYASTRRDFARGSLETLAPGEAPRPLRMLQLLRSDAGAEPDANAPLFAFWFLPDSAPDRVAENEFLAIEYTRNKPEARRRALAEPIPGGALQGLVVEVPAANERQTFAVAPGTRHEIAGYTLEVSELLPEPPFPIVTEGYRGAISSVAVVRVTTPEGEVFDRYIYHRFPEIDQDLLQGQSLDDGRPARRDADPAIGIHFLDDTKIQVYFDEDAEGAVTAIVRGPGRAPDERTIEGDRLTDFVADPNPAAPRLDLRIADRWPHAVAFERPVPTPELEQERDLIGTHRESYTAIEVKANNINTPAGPWTTVTWVPFNPFAGDDPQRARVIDLPDGRSVTIAVGPVRHRFRDFRVGLVDFEMLAYDHRGAPRDYQSTLRVTPRRSPTNDGGLAPAKFETYVHVAKLNAPLRAPFMTSEDRPPLFNLLGRLASGFSPHQFKLSQAGWDQDGWETTLAAFDRGEVSRPSARFTILRVGNNPGIHVIALGAVLIAIGTPYAFYVKPWLVRRERDRLRRAAHDRTGAGETDRNNTEHHDDAGPSAAIESKQAEPAGSLS